MSNKNMESQLRKADELARAGDLGAAATCLRNVLADEPMHPSALTMLSRIMRAEGKFSEAIPVLQKLTKATKEDPWAWCDLGETYEALESFEKAAMSYLKAWSLNRNNARFALNAGYALWQSERRQDALIVWSLGADLDPLVRTAQFRDDADRMTRIKSSTADTELRRHFTQMYSDGLEKHGNPKRLQSAIWPQTHTGRINYQIKNQHPHMFYAPDLPAVPVFDVNELPWAETLKLATPDILDELRAYLESTQDYGRPYVAHMSDGDESWSALKGSNDWNALHLFQDAQSQSCLENFPMTRAALDDVPLVELFGTPMEVFFSVLKPGTHIPPHFGLSNSRLTAHLPLIVPEDCYIRVSNHEHHWRKGELFLFDDSFDHEARNDSDGLRIVLIFEVWRPDLSEVEIEALQDSLEVRTDWINNRKIPDIEI